MRDVDFIEEEFYSQQTILFIISQRGETEMTNCKFESTRCKMTFRKQARTKVAKWEKIRKGINFKICIFHFAF